MHKSATNKDCTTVQVYPSTATGKQTDTRWTLSQARFSRMWLSAMPRKLRARQV